MILSEMIRPAAIAEMIADAYANYVLQTALDFAPPELRAKLVAEIMPLLSLIKSRSWYKRILSKLGLNLNQGNGHPESGRPVMPRGFLDERMAPDHRLGPM